MPDKTSAIYAEAFRLEGEVKRLQEALAAARRAYQPICERVCGDDGEHVTACIRVRAALAAPAAGRDPAIEGADAAWRDGEAHGRDK